MLMRDINNTCTMVIASIEMCGWKGVPLGPDLKKFLFFFSL